MKELVKDIIYNAVKNTLKQNNIDDTKIPNIVIEIPKEDANGDFATNAAFLLTKILKNKPVDIAKKIVENISEDIFDKIEIAGPGFINIFLKKSVFHEFISRVLKDEDELKVNEVNGLKIQVEFVSANPTGPLHIGHGRGAAYGDSISRILSACNYDVQKEYYINDAGNQMNNLAKSIFSRYMNIAGKKYPFPEDGYKGDYIIEIAQKIYDEDKGKLVELSENEALEKCLEIGKGEILNIIKNDLKNFNVTLDNWFSEKSLYETGEMEKTLEFLKSMNKVYEKDGALWFKSKEYGDDKDRVLRKQDGSYTYFASDIAYHKNKFDRGFEKIIDVWGADHHGYVKRLKSSIEAMGYNHENFKVILIQMVSLINAGEKISMSTRAGEFIPLSWLTDEVGSDAARFFYAMRNHESQFEFDVELAKSNSSDNPVYYVQYAHARVKSLLRNAKEKSIDFKLCENLELLTGQEEINIIKKIYEIKNILKLSASHLEPHRIAYYLQELAGSFHSYYYNNKIINEDDIQTTNARLNLSVAVGITIKFGLNLLGVSAPDKM